jgi:hypothetical protein
MKSHIISLEEMERYALELFDDDYDAKKAAHVLKAMLDSDSPRITDLAQSIDGNPENNTKMIHRLLKTCDPFTALNRLLDDDAPFIILDPTEIERKKAYKTDYVGTLSDGKTKGFWMLLLATPYRGRAIPFHFSTYSSATIAAESTSRNREHTEALAHVLPMIGKTPVIIDREFSYDSFFENANIEGLNYVVRLNTSGNPTIRYDKHDSTRKVSFDIKPGQNRIVKDVYYKGNAKVNLAGCWKKGLASPLWVITNMDPENAIELYLKRMKIEQSFKDLKSLLHIDKLMNKTRANMEKTIALYLIAFTIGLLVGEKVRDELYRGEKKMGPLFWPFYNV